MNTRTSAHNALRLTTVPREGSSAVTLSLTAQITQPHNLNTAVLADIYPHLLRSGCGNYTRSQFLEAESSLGTTIRVTATHQSVTLSLTTVGAYIPKALSLLTLLITKPKFQSSELTRTKKYLEELYKNDADDATLQSKNLWYRALTEVTDPAHPHHEQSLNHELKRITPTHMRAFHTDTWHGQWIATYGGDPHFETHIQKFFAQLRKRNTYIPQSKVDVPSLQRTPQTHITAVYQNIPHRQNIEVNIGNILPCSFISTEYPALHFALSILGLPGGFTGRLMSTVREQEGLTYGIYAFVEYTEKDTPSFWRVKTFFSPTDIEKGIQSTYRQMCLLHERGVTRNELERFKAILLTRKSLTLDSILKTVRERHTQHVLDVTPNEIDNFYHAIDNLSLRDVNDAIKKYLDPKHLLFSFAGPLTTSQARLKKVITSLETYTQKSTPTKPK